MVMMVYQYPGRALLYSSTGMDVRITQWAPMGPRPHRLRPNTAIAIWREISRYTPQHWRLTDVLQQLEQAQRNENGDNTGEKDHTDKKRERERETERNREKQRETERNREKQRKTERK